jgi:hypothetical protein
MVREAPENRWNGMAIAGLRRSKEVLEPCHQIYCHFHFQPSCPLCLCGDIPSDLTSKRSGRYLRRLY